MATLARELRKELEKTVVKARIEAEAGARKALEEYAVHESTPYSFMDQQRQQLRERLRARGVQAGDAQHKDGSQTLQHLCAEFAYEHWHRMLFARFLAENGLLIQPGSEMPISLDECRELAKDENKDWLTLASEYAQRMLPAIFRADDPVLELSLPLESRNKLESWLKDLPTQVFLADDSLGWVYQFWQSKKKDEVNDSGVKIGADEIAPVTQLFTEDYMVLFLLHNTLGAWWAAKRKAEDKEHDLPGYEWTYLRFKDDGSPAAGAFEGWPTLARDLKVLDPCMGSGHFLVFALPILVGFRMGEEGLSKRDAITAVLRDNLFGLEIDSRCTQIAAFNLALTAWKMAGGHFQLPSHNLACSGLGIHAKEEDWGKLAGNDPLLRETMKELYQLFRQAPVLGSLIDPKRVGGHLFAAHFEKARPLLKQALAAERKDSIENELAVTAKGLFDAAHILSDEFTLIITNVPYLGRGRQAESLKEHCGTQYSSAKTDLATCMLDRLSSFCASGAATAFVAPQSFLFTPTYKQFRKRLLETERFHGIVRLGPGAFESISGQVVNVCLTLLSKAKPTHSTMFFYLGGLHSANVAEKLQALRIGKLQYLSQTAQLINPDFRIGAEQEESTCLSSFADSLLGLGTCDAPHYVRAFWESPQLGKNWSFMQTAPDDDSARGGREHVVAWDSERRRVFGMTDAERKQGHNQDYRGRAAWGKRGIAISLMGLKTSGYTGELFDKSVAVLIPKQESALPALTAYCTSAEFSAAVWNLEQRLMITNGTFTKVPFDFAYWEQMALEKFPTGIKWPQSNDPTQWLFNGHPQGADQPLQVAVARLIGYRWPRQTGSSFPDWPQLDEDGLEQFVADDGIVCLSALQGRRPAADRLSKLLGAAFGHEWPENQQELLKQAGAKSTTLEDWLRDEFFVQHCELFDHRPFIWHISDGLDKGFHALINYHKVAAPNEEGKRILEKLTYTYLGEWIERQRNQQKQNVPGSDARLASALHLQQELKKVLAGEAPYDIFVRWKPLHEQAIGWEPDINDGVRMNIRPFVKARPLTAKGKNVCILRVRPGTSLKWTKDKGTEPHREKQDFPWFWSWDEQAEDFAGGAKFDGNRWNDLHYSLDMKRKARAQHESKGKKGQHA
jgi:hypothetical protein